MKTFEIENHETNNAHNPSTLGFKIMALGIYGAYFALAVIYFWFGGMKFTHSETVGLVPLVSNTPFLGWVYNIFSVDTFSSLLGVVEVSIGTLIAGRLLSPKFSLIGGALSAGLFFTTLSVHVLDRWRDRARPRFSRYLCRSRPVSTQRYRAACRLDLCGRPFADDLGTPMSR